MARWESVVHPTNPHSGIADAREALTGRMSEEDTARHLDILRMNAFRAFEGALGEAEKWKSFVATLKHDKLLVAAERRTLVELSLMIDRRLQA